MISLFLSGSERSSVPSRYRPCSNVLWMVWSVHVACSEGSLSSLHSLHSLFSCQIFICSSCRISVHKKCHTKVEQVCSMASLPQVRYTSVNHHQWSNEKIMLSIELILQPSTHFFGANICALPEDENGVPVILSKLLMTLEVRALFLEGIYRFSLFPLLSLIVSSLSERVVEWVKWSSVVPG